MAQQQPIGRDASSGNREIPDKLYFRIGEVAALCEVPAYVLRFWETEFPQLRPNKGGTGQRLYRRRDVEMALRVKTLLYDQGFTIPGARQLLKAEQKQKEPTLAFAVAEPEQADAARLRKLRRELREVLAILSKPTGSSRGRELGAVAAQQTGVVQAIRAVPGPHAVVVEAQAPGADRQTKNETLFEQPRIFGDNG